MAKSEAKLFDVVIGFFVGQTPGDDRATVAIRATVISEAEPFTAAKLDYWNVGPESLEKLRGLWDKLTAGAALAGAKQHGDIWRVKNIDYATLVAVEAVWAQFNADLAGLGEERLAAAAAEAPAAPAEDAKPGRRRRRRGR